MRGVCGVIQYSLYPDRAPLKEVLGGQYNYREGGGKCCGKALKAAGGVEVVDVIRIRAPKMSGGPRIAQSRWKVHGNRALSARRDV